MEEFLNKQTAIRGQTNTAITNFEKTAKAWWKIRSDARILEEYWNDFDDNHKYWINLGFLLINRRKNTNWSLKITKWSLIVESSFSSERIVLFWSIFGADHKTLRLIVIRNRISHFPNKTSKLIHFTANKRLNTIAAERRRQKVGVNHPRFTDKFNNTYNIIDFLGLQVW